jgi:hypothetical protein
MPETSTSQDVSGSGNLVVAGDVTFNSLQGALPETLELAGLRVLLDKVRADWIDGFLKDSVRAEGALEVRATPSDGDIERPWHSMREPVGRLQKHPVSTVSVSEAFSATGRALLILGEPGSGKTIALLTLASTLASVRPATLGSRFRPFSAYRAGRSNRGHSFHSSCTNSPLATTSLRGWPRRG